MPERPLADIVAELEELRNTCVNATSQDAYKWALLFNASRLIAAAKALETARAKLTDSSLYECDQIEQALAVIDAAMRGRNA